METSIKTFCLASVKHPDALMSKFVAAVCFLPHLSLIFQWSVAYASKDIPLLIFALGAIVNVALSFSLKRLLQVPRPESACKILEKCSSPGMPSSHAQVMGYALGTYLLFHRRNVRARRLGKENVKVASFLEALELVALGFGTIATSAARVILGYHDVIQVTVGCLLGLLVSTFVSILVERLDDQGLLDILQRNFGHTFGIQNSWSIAEIRRTETSAGSYKSK